MLNCLRFICFPSEFRGSELPIIIKAQIKKFICKCKCLNKFKNMKIINLINFWKWLTKQYLNYPKKDCKHTLQLYKIYSILIPKSSKYQYIWTDIVPTNKFASLTILIVGKATSKKNSWQKFNRTIINLNLEAIYCKELHPTVLFILYIDLTKFRRVPIKLNLQAAWIFKRKFGFYRLWI